MIHTCFGIHKVGVQPKLKGAVAVGKPLHTMKEHLCASIVRAEADLNTKD